jgi:hypothetical protein
MSKARGHWIFMRDGKLILYSENADFHFLKHGLEESERQITREEAERTYPRILKQVDEILVGVRKETDMF